MGLYTPRRCRLLRAGWLPAGRRSRGLDPLVCTIVRRHTTTSAPVKPHIGVTALAQAQATNQIPLHRRYSCVVALLHIVFLSAVAATVSGVEMEIDISRLMAEIRTAVGAQMPNLSFERGGELRSDLTGFSLTWTDNGKDRLHVSCSQYSSGDDAIRQLRQMRTMISAGVPKPLHGVADEAYYLNTYGWHTYFARGVFVCHVGGRTEESTRRLTDIVVKHVGATVPEKAS